MMMFSFFERLAASVNDSGSGVRMSGIVFLAAFLLRLRPLCMGIDLNHDDFCNTIVALLPVLTVSNTAFYHWIHHI
jgi:hypothetical protein